MARADGRRPADRLLRPDRADAGSDPGRCARLRAATPAAGFSTGQDVDNNGSRAGVAVVWARSDDGAVRGFLVPAGTEGSTRLTSRTSSRSWPRPPPSWCSRLPTRRGRGVAGRQLAARTACVSQRGALRNRLGSRRGGARLPGAALEYSSSRVQFGRPISPARSSSRSSSRCTWPSTTAPARDQDRAPQGSGSRDARAHQLRQVQQRADGDRRRAAARAPCSRQRHHAGVPGDAPSSSTSSRFSPTRAPIRSMRSCSQGADRTFGFRVAPGDAGRAGARSRAR